MTEQAATLDRPADLSTVRTYQAARDEVTRLEADLERAKKKLERQARRVLTLFEQHGVSSVRVDGRLVYLQRSVYARRKPTVPPDVLLDTLEAAGFGDVVKRVANPQTLAALYREHERDGDGLDPRVLALLEVSEVYEPRMRKG